MPARRESQSTIDKLPEAQRRKVLDALLTGVPLRKVGEIAGCSHEAVKRYRDRVVLPAIRKAQQIQSFQPLNGVDAVNITERTALTRDIVQSSPFRVRLEKLWKTAEESLEKAKKGVREVKDGNGKVVSMAQDLCAIAPLLNQAHKNVELLGRVTGELEIQAGANVAIQIVMPSAAGPGDAPELPAIDIGIVKR